MKYVEAASARAMGGLRLALTAHVPGPWSESAKKIFEYKKIPYVPVAQYAGQENSDLVAWTGTRNAPIAIYEDEAPRASWYDILMLGERLAPERPLLPSRSEERALVVGISAELCSEWGFGWVRRTMMLMGMPQAGTPDPKRLAKPSTPSIRPEEMARLQKSYGVSVGGTEEACHRAADILRMLAARLHRQKADGSPYLVGHSITACDIYWAVFSMALEPLPYNVNPMSDQMRQAYETIGPVLEPLKDPILLEHRNAIYQRYLPLPLDF